ncbi:TPA: hypothetical protein ACH3X1_011502 [Trebouxia sp. C0004]
MSQDSLLRIYCQPEFCAQTVAPMLQSISCTQRKSGQAPRVYIHFASRLRMSACCNQQLLCLSFDVFVNDLYCVMRWTTHLNTNLIRGVKTTERGFAQPFTVPL